MKSWVKVEKSSSGLSAAIVIFDRIALYAGRTGHWGIGLNVNLYDRSFTVEILNWYLGFEVYHNESI